MGHKVSDTELDIDDAGSRPREVLSKETHFALGTGRFNVKRVVRFPYKVRIRYSEPQCELRNGTRNKPYSWTFDIRAASAESARAEALRLFHEIARESSVNWRREIVDVEVT